MEHDWGKRNPFYIEKPKAKAVSSLYRKLGPDLVLEGIFLGSNKPSVIINGTVLGVGYKINGSTVRKINENSVFLTDEQGAKIVLSLKSGGSALKDYIQFSFVPSDSITVLNSEMDQAIQRVKEIVNQPIRSLPRESWMQVSSFSPGWFHPGAITPDFNIVDVRTTQEMSYDKDDYVTSDLNPGVVFVGKELEFNPMTKYFYTDRSLPKKKLSEDEMLEINKLYRIIGSCEQELAKLQNTNQ